LILPGLLLEPRAGRLLLRGWSVEDRAPFTESDRFRQSPDSRQGHPLRRHVLHRLAPAPGK
jgi:hypothetical protein